MILIFHKIRTFDCNEIVFWLYLRKYWAEMCQNWHGNPSSCIDWPYVVFVVFGKWLWQFSKVPAFNHQKTFIYHGFLTIKHREYVALQTYDFQIKFYSTFYLFSENECCTPQHQQTKKIHLVTPSNVVRGSNWIHVIAEKCLG